MLIRLIAAFADAETDPVDFSIAPALAIPKVMNFVSKSSILLLSPVS
jgi:hypothetical protein